MNILICEKQSELLGGHVIKLQRAFCPSTFDYAEDGQQVIEKIKSSGFSYDLILSRYDMPKMTGEEIYKFIRKSKLVTPFILLSDSNLRIEENPSDDFFCLDKSYNLENLKEVIDTMVSQNSVD